MGSLSPDYYANAIKNNTVTPPVTAPSPVVSQPMVQPQSTSFSSLTSQPAPQISTPSSIPQPGSDPLLAKSAVGDVTARLGPLGVTGAALGVPFGPVGIAGGALIGASIGASIQYPDNWNDLPLKEKIGFIGGQAASKLVGMVMHLPGAITRGVVGVGVTALKPTYNLLTGKKADLNTLVNEPKVDIPYLGEIPTFYSDIKEGVVSGMGPLASTFMSAGNLALNSAMMYPVAEVLGRTFQPRAKSGTPGVIQNTAPVEMLRDQGATSIKTPSTSEYYTLRKSDAAQFGGNSSTVQWKFTPASEGETSLAIVRQVSKSTKIGSWIKTDFGLKQVTQGNFGPEIKMWEHTVPKGPVISKPVDISKISVPSRVDPGFELKPITEVQMKTLNDIGTLKGLDISTRDAVIRSLTGKEVIGEMTQKQFVDVAQSLSKFGEAYSTKASGTGPVGYGKMYVSPQRHVFDYAEDVYGLPLKSKIYNPMEDAARFSKVLRSSLNKELDAVFGDLASPKYTGQRKLIDSYARGNPDAILKNEALSSSEKGRLIEAADKLIAWDKKNGTVLDVGEEAYLKNYGGPKIANISGIVPKYKDLNVVPTKSFFAKEKRTGSLNTFIDDPLASRQIYVKQGADSLHFGPVLENAKGLLDAVPSEYKAWKDAANSYMQEKLGYQGAMEKFVDSFVPAINKKFGRLGIDLPADASRQGIGYFLSSLYSGLVGTPKAIFQQLFQYPLFVYPKLGADFAGEAFMKSFSTAEYERVAAQGWFNDIALPYGEELAGMSAAGRIGNAFKTGTQATIRPLTFFDNRVRFQTFLQAELKWNNALNLFNEGKIEWSALESKIDLKSFSNADRTSIREALAAGKNDDAFSIYMRENIDEGNVPYRTATGARVSNGMAGKLSTGLLTYTIDTTNTIAKWLSTGQYDKFIRFAGAAKATNDTMQETFGINFKDVIYQKYQGIASPVIGLASDMYDYISALSDNNRKEMNANADSITRLLKNGLPIGVLRHNADIFWKSVNIGPDPEGKYAVYDDSGRIIYSTDFSNLFWGTLMGFPTNVKVAERDIHTDEINAITKHTELQQEVNQMVRESINLTGDAAIKAQAEISDFITKTGVAPSNGAGSSLFIPRNIRTYQQLSPQDKGKFAPRVFPGAFNGVQ